MEILNSFIFQLLGRKPTFKCSKCGKSGGCTPYVRTEQNSDAQFWALGKDEHAQLIIECKNCATKYTYDPLWGGIKEFDELAYVAKEYFGIDTSKNSSEDNKSLQEMNEEIDKKRRAEEQRQIEKSIGRHRKH